MEKQKENQSYKMLTAHIRILCAPCTVCVCVVCFSVLFSFYYLLEYTVLTLSQHMCLAHLKWCTVAAVIIDEHVHRDGWLRRSEIDEN